MSTRSRVQRWSSLAMCVGLGAGCALQGEDAGDAETSELTASVTQSFQDGVGPNAGYAGTRDAYLADATPTTNFGTTSELIVDGDYPDASHHRALILLRWDLASIPAGSTVQAVSVSLGITNPSAGSYSLYALSRDWTESQVTWNQAASGVSWASPGARGASDRDATVLGTLTVTTTGTHTLALNAAGLAVVQGWVDAPATNHGFVVDNAANTDGLRFTSREGASAADRPKLGVTYAAPASGNGTGLHADYFANVALSGTPAVSRTDATVGFDWGAGSPASSLPTDHFSARWTGSIVPRYSETYTFTTTSDDGARLWIDGVELVNNWTDHAATANTGTLALTAGRSYSVRYEYYENGGSAVAKLAWASPSQAAEIVPQSRLFVPSTGAGDAGAGDSGHDAAVDGGHDAGPVDSGHDAGTTPTDGGTGDSGTPPGGDGTVDIIPTNYAYPFNAIFVSVASGSDSNPGSLSQPVHTLAQAIHLSASGGTIVLRAGDYRESIASIGKTLTLQPYPGERVWFKGSTVVASNTFVTEAGAFRLDAWNPSICHTNCAGGGADEDYFTGSIPAAEDTENVYFDGVPQTAVTSRAAVVAGTFYDDYANHRIYVGTDPSGHRVEISSLAYAMQFDGAGSGSTVRGLGFEHYATSVDVAHHPGALVANTTNLTFENDTVAYNTAVGILTNAAHVTIRDCLIARNGFNGVNSNRSDGLVITGTRLDHNNLRHIADTAGRSLGGGGIKVCRTKGITFTDNVVTYSDGKGFWCDLSCYQATIARNVFAHNTEHGVFYEISSQGVIASNLIVDNGSYGLKIGSSHVRIYNNTVANNGQAILIYDDSRPAATCTDNIQCPTADEVALGITWDASDVTVVNNLLVDDSGNALVETLDGNAASAPHHVTSDQLIPAGQMDDNGYGRPTASAPATLVRWATRPGSTTVYSNYASLAAFTAATGRDAHGLYEEGSATYFVNAAGGNYHLAAGTPAATGGAPLPADIAAAIGVTAGVPVARGALRWPGM